jgi:hypothetical protein
MKTLGPKARRKICFVGGGFGEVEGKKVDEKIEGEKTGFFASALALLPSARLILSLFSPFLLYA